MPDGNAPRTFDLATYSEVNEERDRRSGTTVALAWMIGFYAVLSGLGMVVAALVIRALVGGHAR